MTKIIQTVSSVPAWYDSRNAAIACCSVWGLSHRNWRAWQTNAVRYEMWMEQIQQQKLILSRKRKIKFKLNQHSQSWRRQDSEHMPKRNQFASRIHLHFDFDSEIKFRVSCISFHFIRLNRLCSYGNTGEFVGIGLYTSSVVRPCSGKTA